MTTLLLAATPLHAFLALGLRRGPYAAGEAVLALIDQPPEVADPLADALAAARWPGLSLQRHTRLARGRSRQQLAAWRAAVRSLAPTTVTVGNDQRIEFHAAVAEAPQARCVYSDDGLYSYLPHAEALPPWREALAGWRRRLKHGFPVERPSLLGGSRAVHEGIVLMPGHVHAGLAGKPLRAYEPSWFAGDAVRAVCLEAAARAGFDARRAAATRLLVLLPHPRFLRADPALVATILAQVRRVQAEGGEVVLKSHPNAGGRPVAEQLGVAPGGWTELPARLPVEVLAPLLSDTLVLGTVTTALLTLARLARVEVRSLPVPAGAGPLPAGAAAIYAAAGVRPFDGPPVAAAFPPLP